MLSIMDVPAWCRKRGRKRRMHGSFMATHVMGGNSWVFEARYIDQSFYKTCKLPRNGQHRHSLRRERCRAHPRADLPSRRAIKIVMGSAVWGLTHLASVGVKMSKEIKMRALGVGGGEQWRYRTETGQRSLCCAVDMVPCCADGSILLVLEPGAGDGDECGAWAARRRPVVSSPPKPTASTCRPRIDLPFPASAKP